MQSYKKHSTALVSIGATLLLLLGGVGAYYITKYQKSTDDTKQPHTGTISTSSAVRAIRNKNLGNIRVSGDNWQGEVKPEDKKDTEFEEFISFEYGVRAQLKLLNNYITKLGRNTLNKIINAYSPSHENDTAALITRYATELKVDPSAPYPTDRDSLIRLGMAIAKVEAGKQGEGIITRELYESAYDLI